MGETSRTRRWRPRAALTPAALATVLSPMRRGGTDPAQRREGAHVWKAMRTPQGPATLWLHVCSDGELEATAWGPGSEWLLDVAPGLVGDRDDDEGFIEMARHHPLLHEARRQHAAWRVPRSRLVLEALVPAILEQKVTGMEAHQSWASLLWAYGELAPGPTPRMMRVPPSPEQWRQVPSWAWHRAGVDGKRSATVMRVCQVAGRMEETLAMPHGEAERRMCSIPGVGVWTAAEVRQRAHGDPDAVSVGDFHLCKRVGVALIGQPVDDDGMLELLAPYAGHRYRVQRLIELHAPRLERHAPRFSPRDYRAI